MLKEREIFYRALATVGVFVLLALLFTQAVKGTEESVEESPEQEKKVEVLPEVKPKLNKKVINETTTKPKVISQPTTSTGALTSAQIDFLWNCESGRVATTNTGNGYYGGFQFDIPTWNEMGTKYARADLAPHTVQVAAVQKLLSYSSIWSRFPGCAAKMEAAGLL